MNSDSDDWASADGAPPVHLIEAALRTAVLIDANGSTKRSTRHSYQRDPTGGLFAVEDLRRGEQLLLDCGLVREENEILYPVVELADLAKSDLAVAREVLLSAALSRSAPYWLVDVGEQPLSVPLEARAVLEELIPSPERREAFLLTLGNDSSSEERHAAIGLKGEEAVVTCAREELDEMGHPELAEAVRRVSAYSDRLGYDITAPLIGGGVRRLEVKTTTRPADETVIFFLSRNEADVGQRDLGWALVVCSLAQDETSVIGWCRGRTLSPYLPTDATSGRWRVTEVVLPAYVLFPGIPPAL